MSLNQLRRLNNLCFIFLLWLTILSGSISLSSAQDAKQIVKQESEKTSNLRTISSVSARDTILHFSLPPVEIEGEYNHLDKRKEHKYHQLYEDIKRTYPLLMIVTGEIKMVNAQLDSINKTKSQQKAYLRWYEKHIYHTYLDTLKSLNLRQTRLFIKLIKRETGDSPYALIKKYRGGLDAFLWQATANALFINLKSIYDPIEDAQIEDILVKYY